MNKFSKTQELNVDDLLEWRAQQKVMYACDSKGKKKLLINLNGGYEIEVDGKTIWEGLQAFPAVEKYNSIY